MEHRNLVATSWCLKVRTGTVARQPLDDKNGDWTRSGKERVFRVAVAHEPLGKVMHGFGGFVSPLLRGEIS